MTQYKAKSIINYARIAAALTIATAMILTGCKQTAPAVTDKTPPAPVTNLTATYSSADKKITVNWTNPTDADFAGLTLKWKKEGETTETEVPLEKGKTSHAIEGIEVGGIYTITVTVKDNVGNESKAEVLSITDYSAYTVGKIVLANKMLAADAYSAIDPKNPPVGIICRYNTYKAPLMIALHTNGSGLEWAKDGSTGCTKKFESIICTPSVTGKEAAGTATFTGDTDGSDNDAWLVSFGDGDVDYDDKGNLYRVCCLAGF